MPSRMILLAAAITVYAAGPAAGLEPWPIGATAHGRTTGPPAVPRTVQDTIGRGLYLLGCASCHGADGGGVVAERRAFEVEVPDFKDCSFSSREPDFDWLAVVHQGGPVRAFDTTMPAFGEAFTEDQILEILRYVRTFCGDDAWPRGELNLPRALFTEKAYPEDEAVLTVEADAEGRSVVNTFVYEKRFGARNQIELKIPFGAAREFEPGRAPVGERTGPWQTGLGDIALGYKRALAHGLSSGTILSGGVELIAPTGTAAAGLGGDAWVVEPFVAFGAVLPADGFLHAQALAEAPTGGDGETEAALRLVLGRTWTQGRWGRAWSPMLEVLAGRELESGAEVAWDLVPQVQVTLNTRQHVMANAGVRVPVGDGGARRTTLLLYVLWDWFDGGFFDGW